MAEKPVPAPSEETAPYWEGARRRELVLPRCTGCGWYVAQPRLVCPKCQGETFDWHPVSGTGKIHTCTIVHQAAAPGFDVPYVVVRVSLDEQPECLITTNLVGEYDVERLDIGLPVVVEFEERGGVSLPQFRLE